MPSQRTLMSPWELSRGTILGFLCESTVDEPTDVSSNRIAPHPLRVARKVHGTYTSCGLERYHRDARTILRPRPPVSIHEWWLLRTMQTILRKPRPIARALGEDGVAPCVAVGFHACHCSSCGALRCILRPMRRRKSEPHIPSDRRVLPDHRPTRQTDHGTVSIERPRRRLSGAAALPLGGLERNRVRVGSNQVLGFERESIWFPRGSNRCVCVCESQDV